MKIFNAIQLRNDGPICRDCAHFKNDPAHIEAAYPGLTIMSSGFASVRDQDGFCNLNQLYLSAGDCCPGFKPHETE
jgi:hypothetical protein